jgi:hypothetical protein
MAAALDPGVGGQGVRPDLACHGPAEVIAAFVTGYDANQEIDTLELLGGDRPQQHGRDLLELQEARRPLPSTSSFFPVLWDGNGGRSHWCMASRTYSAGSVRKSPAKRKFIEDQRRLRFLGIHRETGDLGTEGAPELHPLD